MWGEGIVMLLVIAIAMVVVFGLQAWNRRGKGQKVAPAQVFKIHMLVGVLTLVFFLVHGLPKILGGYAPLPNMVTGVALGVVLLATVLLGAYTKSSRGALRKALARYHGIGATVALVLLVVHVGLAIF